MSELPVMGSPWAWLAVGYWAWFCYLFILFFFQILVQIFFGFFFFFGLKVEQIIFFKKIDVVSKF